MSVAFCRTAISAARISLRSLVFLLAALSLSSCSKDELPKNVTDVTLVKVHKFERRLKLYNGDNLVREYEISLGSSPAGHKYMRGDGRTPVGNYVIDRRNPQSKFYRSLGISYPNERDMRVASLLNMNPGGDIFIHGQPNNSKRQRKGDWTEGCIAVSNADMKEIYSLVDIGTPIHLYH